MKIVFLEKRKRSDEIINRSRSKFENENYNVENDD